MKWRTDSQEMDAPYFVTRRLRNGAVEVSITYSAFKRTMDDESVLAWCLMEDVLDLIPPYPDE